MSTSDEAAAQVPEPAQRSRRRRIGTVGLIIIFSIIVYVLAILAYSGSGRSNVDKSAAPVSPGGNGVNIGMDLVGMDTTRNQMMLRVLLSPEGSYYDAANSAWAKSVRVTVPYQTAGSAARDISAGSPVGGATEYAVYVDGNPQTYPFDQYDLNLVVPLEYKNQVQLDPSVPTRIEGDDLITEAPLIVIQDLGPDGKVLPGAVPVGLGGEPGGLQGWREVWSFTATDNVLYAEATVKRSGGVLAFVIVILLLMISAMVLAVIVATRVAKKKRPIEATMASWFAALLFALIPLRNFMPNSPAIGAWIDVTVFFWVEVGLLVAMGVFIGSWLRYRKPPKDSGSPW